MFWRRSGELRLSRDLRFQVQDLIAPGDCSLLSLYSRPLLSLEPGRRCIGPCTCATLRVGRGGFSVPVDPQAACSPGSFCCGVRGQSSAIPSGLPGHASPTHMKRIGNAVNEDDASKFHDSVEIWVTTGWTWPRQRQLRDRGENKRQETQQERNRDTNYQSSLKKKLHNAMNLLRNLIHSYKHRGQAWVGSLVTSSRRGRDSTTAHSQCGRRHLWASIALMQNLTQTTHRHKTS